jgi:contact-dependent growth inhibition (CDI) system CdiI-like immunity protein
MSKSISELIAKEWPPLGPTASHFHRHLHDAVTKPVDSLNTADLRILISQDIGLAFVMPLALPLVEQDPLIEVEYFRGDLLAAMLRASSDFYLDHPDIRHRMEKIVDAVPNALDKLDHVDFDTTSESLDEALAAFRAHRR